MASSGKGIIFTIFVHTIYSFLYYGEKLDVKKIKENFLLAYLWLIYMLDFEFKYENLGKFELFQKVKK